MMARLYYIMKVLARFQFRRTVVTAHYLPGDSLLCDS